MKKQQKPENEFDKIIRNGREDFEKLVYQMYLIERIGMVDKIFNKFVRNIKKYYERPSKQIDK